MSADAILTALTAAMSAIAFGGLASVLLRSFGEGMARYTGTYSHQTARDLEDIFLFIPPQRIAELGWAAAIAVFLITAGILGRNLEPGSIALALTIALIAGALTLRLPGGIVQLMRKRRLVRFNLQLGDTLVNMSNALKAGFSITQAIESVVRDGENPIAQEFDVLLHQTRVGVSFSQALQNLDDRVGSEDLKLVIVAIETARRTGGNLTEIFEQIAATIRERLRIERRIRTLTAQGRLQGIIVSLLPIVIGCALVFVDPEMMLPFLHSGLGATILGTVAALIAIGGLIIRRIVRIDV